jgi:carbonic anhydrase
MTKNNNSAETDWKSRLIEGYQQFRAGDYVEQKALYEDLGKHGQSPKIMLIGCSDSRADPSNIFNAYPGQMFVARNIANAVPPADPTTGYHGTSATIQFAVEVLGVEMLVVMGHESCGGIKGCIDGLSHQNGTGYIGSWVSLIDEVHDRVVARKTPDEDLQFEMELENVRQSLKNLMTFDFVREAVESGRLKLQGAYFSIIQARLLLSDESGKFSEVPVA